MAINQTLDIIVRFHDVRRLRELDRAIFSIVTQTYRPLHILLAVQRFSQDEIGMVQEAISLLQKIDGAPAVTIVNWEEAEPADGRSALINQAIQHAQGRYLAFLDYDDVLYPEAYDLLIGRLRTSDAAIAFGGINISNIDVFETFLRVSDRTFPYVGSNLIDLFDGNFCPIHSFVLDRSMISAQHLFFEPLMNKDEDYDFLIRICSQYCSDFALVATYIGTYYHKSDGSNTVLTEAAARPGQFSAWQDAENFVEARRRTTPVSFAVQRQLGLAPTPNLTVRGILNRKGLPAKEYSETVTYNAEREPIPLFVTPGHHHSPIPYPQMLRDSSFERRRREDRLQEVKLDFDTMEATFRQLMNHSDGLDFPDVAMPSHRYYKHNDIYGIGDATILACMIRLLRPKRIIEVGSGFSTAALLDTLDRTPDLSPTCLFIEPFAERLHSVLRADDLPHMTILPFEVQEVSLDVFKDLDSEDILFLNTTHISKTGSDVNCALFEILPSLRRGVVVHFHGVFADFEYPSDWIYDQNRAWNEQYILRAFLMYNDSFDIFYANDSFATARTEFVRLMCPTILENRGSGLWLRKR